ncbi:uncharacterized protein DUF222 [Homoserinimonas aerilata]|uniref:Uncharacterized protein DUF222 n=1 Tax=Homoserinimonas aerilata TaxID=1162970 RepID=A0A542YIC8_9MICO|nr:HNH endonuclease signature motif containing protein [Homoserinimonas aerilata]TQL47761.1 uncharacterized protein DUF222 [Homoserinimonas aerilata]
MLETLSRPVIPGFHASIGGRVQGDGVEALDVDFRAMADGDLLASAALVEEMGRRVDSLRVAVAGEIAHRSRSGLGTDSLAARRGCRTAAEMLRRVTLVAGATAARRIKLGTLLRPAMSLTGEVLPASFPQVAAAVEEGVLGMDSALAIVSGLSSVVRRVGDGAVAAAEVELVASALGLCERSDVEEGAVEQGIPATADEIAEQAKVWGSYLDPDGAEPSEERAMKRRSFSRGVERDGLVYGTYSLLPEIAAKFTRLFDACLSPRTAGVFLDAPLESDADAPADTRTPDQQRHDVVAAMVDTFARSGEAPTIGGAAPTVLVSVDAESLRSGHGVGHIDGIDTPVSLRTIKQFSCAGGVQRVVIDSDGRIIELGSPQRCFTPAQRRAITLRDGGCVIPGCRVPAAWAEIHHVVPDADGGPTHTDNGVLLCWFHHRSIDTSGWEIRMSRGSPQIKAPPWLGGSGRWLPAGKSPTRRSRELRERLC